MIIGQPENYPDVLRRVFWTTLVIGIGCSIALAGASPELKKFFDQLPYEAELGSVKGLKLLHVVIPAVVALLSRIVKLHDRVSDVFGLRAFIDSEWILLPLARRSGAVLDDARERTIRIRRKELMYKVFYPYVSLHASAIDKQLVRSALDNYGWFWSVLEALVLVVPTTIALCVMSWSGWSLLALVTSIVLMCLAWMQWGACKCGTAAEVDAILDDASRRSQIATHFARL
ncbi:MAG: hypothetical protein ACT4PN_03125 [Nitrospiraceae bacterium]